MGNTDFVVVGTGAAGLIGAIAARKAGLHPVIIEKAPVWGGTTALSGGVLWMPGNPLMLAAGETDAREDILAYMRALSSQDGPAASAERRDAFLDTIPTVMNFLRDLGVSWVRSVYPDYNPGEPGARVGRSVVTALYDGRRLGPWLATMRSPPAALPAFMTDDAPSLVRPLSTMSSIGVTLKVLAQNLVWRVLGHRQLAMGASFVGQLMEIVQRLEIPVRLDTKLTGLIQENGRVTGVRIEHRGEAGTIAAAAGVMLCAGGFAHNNTLRRHHQAVGAGWSTANPDDTGEVLEAGVEAGAATSLMDSAWWMPAILTGPNAPSITLPERTLPGSIIVDSGGRRYMDEAQSYMDAGRAMTERHKTVPAAPSWLVMDGRFPDRYRLGAIPRGAARQAMIERGELVTADSLDALAAKCGIDAAGLKATVARFNGFARSGVDEDFGRGGNVLDRHWGDPRAKPNPTLGPIEATPFWACKIYPGDLGTNGGLLTDIHGRVLSPDQTPIPGLYAAGNTTASVTGRSYPGGGGTLGPAAVFAYLAGQHAGQTRP